MRRLVRLLAKLDVFFVGVHCPLPELERREKERGDRRIGEARTDFETIHEFAEYDFEVSGTAPSDVNVSSVIARWKSRRSPSSFEKIALTLPNSE